MKKILSVLTVGIMASCLAGALTSDHALQASQTGMVEQAQAQTSSSETLVATMEATMIAKTVAGSKTSSGMSITGTVSADKASSSGTSRKPLSATSNQMLIVVTGTTIRLMNQS